MQMSNAFQQLSPASAHRRTIPRLVNAPSRLMLHFRTELFGLSGVIGVRFSGLLRAWRPRLTNRTNRNHLGPLVIAAAIYLFSPTVTAYQDMTSLLSGSESGEGRWS